MSKYDSQAGHMVDSSGVVFGMSHTYGGLLVPHDANLSPLLSAISVCRSERAMLDPSCLLPSTESDTDGYTP